MSDTVTWDGAYEQLLRETNLGEQIEEMAEYLRVAERSLGSSLGYMFTGPRLAVLVGQLRELRARRMAAEREPDDEVNAPVDMCTCSASVSGQMRCGPVSHGCPLHPVPHLHPGFRADADERLAALKTAETCSLLDIASAAVGPDDYDDIDWEAGPPVRPEPEPYPSPVKRRPPSHREFAEAEGVAPSGLDLPLLPDGPGEHGEPAWARGAAMPGDPLPDCDGAPAEAECHYLGGGECEPVTCPVAMGAPDPEAIARRLLGELGPELAMAVCVQLLGRLPRREP